MIYKKTFSLLMIFIIGMPKFCTYAVSNLNTKTVIVYDRENIYGYSSNVLSSMEELLGAFNTNIKAININDYKASDINNYDCVIVLSIEGNINKEEFILDLRNYNKKIFWIGEGIDNLLKDNTKYNIEYFRKVYDATFLYYSSNRDEILTPDKMERFILGSTGGVTIAKPKNDKAKVYSYLSNGKDIYPFVINDENLWYISKTEASAISFYVLSDILNDFYDRKNVNKGQVFVRIEDVHPFREPKELREIADYLYGENVPYMIALVPVYFNPTTGHETTMHEKPDFVEAIKYMQDHGGAIVLHGYSHQRKNDVVSGEGFEFWDGKKDEPLDIDMGKCVYEKVSKGVKECVEDGIYPLAFEAPHYAMDMRGYKEIKKYFSTYVGQFQSNNIKFTTTSFPFILYDTNAFNKLIPENLGYIDPENTTAVFEIKDNFKMVSMVRGYTAGFFFHPYVDIKYLKELVSYFKENDVKFYNLKDDENYVKCDDIKIISKGGSISVEGNIPKRSVNRTKNIIWTMDKLIIIIVGVFCIAFLIIIIISKRRDRKKFIR